MADHLGTPEVMKLLCVSLRQLTYWCAKGYIPGQPKSVGSGRQRLWTPGQVERVRMLKVASDLRSMLLPELANRLEATRDLFEVAS